MKKEQGYFLLETVILSMVLVALAAACVTYRTIDRQRLYTEDAVTAAFLAQEQIALVEVQPQTILQSSTTFPWLGTSSLMRNGRQFDLQTVLTDEADSTSLRLVTVTVSWSEQDHSYTKSYYKRVPCHD